MAVVPIAIVDLAPRTVIEGIGLPEPVAVFAVAGVGPDVQVSGLGVVTGAVHRPVLKAADLTLLRLSDGAATSRNDGRVSPTSLPMPRDRDNNFWYVHNDSETAFVFVHGVFSGSRGCWLHKADGRTVFWPDLLRVDSRFGSPSIYLSGYSTSIDAGDFPIDQCAREVLEALERHDTDGHPPVLDKKQIVFVCHSTGGIVVRYLLCRYPDRFRKIGVGIALIASPSRGSVWANVAGIAASYANQTLGNQLRWRGDTIEEIHNRFKDLVNNRDAEMPGLFGMEACETQMVFRKAIPRTVRWLLPNRLKVVTTESAGQYFGQVKYLAGTDHFSCAKPDSLTHPSHEFLETFLRRFGQFVRGQNTATDGSVESLRHAAPAPGRHGDSGAGDSSEFDADYVRVQHQIIAEHANRFVGRRDVAETLAKFRQASRRGYFVVTGRPGLGKTALVCHLAEKYGLICHLTKQSNGRADPRQILCSLLYQIAQRLATAVDYSADLPTLTKTYEALLKNLAETAGPVTMLIDALDELQGPVGADLPFLPRDALPEGVYLLMTVRPGERFDALRDALGDVPVQVYELAALTRSDVTEVLRHQGRSLSDRELEWIADTSHGSPLYLRALLDEMAINPHFDLNELPATVEGYFRRAIGRLPQRGPLTEVVGVLAAARSPLSERDLAEITGLEREQVYDAALRPIQPYLIENDGGYSFYHESFTTFVRAELVDAAGMQAAHASIARWLTRADRRSRSYAWRSLAYHLFESSNGDELLSTINQDFLAEKVRRFGFAAIDDLELLTRWLIETGNPSVLDKLVAIVERLRTVAGGDLMADIERSTRFAQVVSRPDRAILSRSITSATADVYLGMIPRIGVSADFGEVVASGTRLWIAIGDAPASGLKSAFVARFVANLFRNLATSAPDAGAGPLLSEIRRTLRPFEYFDRFSMQCAVIDVEAGRIAIASAGHPPPVLYSARRRACDRLPVRGPLLERSLEQVEDKSRFVECTPDDVLVLVSDGLTEGGRLREPYGYRFTSILERHASQSAKAIGEAILEDWRSYPRSASWVDDVTLIVVAFRPQRH